MQLFFSKQHSPVLIASPTPSQGGKRWLANLLQILLDDFLGFLPRACKSHRRSMAGRVLAQGIDVASPRKSLTEEPAYHVSVTVLVQLATAYEAPRGQRDECRQQARDPMAEVPLEICNRPWCGRRRGRAMDFPTGWAGPQTGATRDQCLMVADRPSVDRRNATSGGDYQCFWTHRSIKKGGLSTVAMEKPNSSREA